MLQMVFFEQLDFVRSASGRDPWIVNQLHWIKRRKDRARTLLRRSTDLTLVARTDAAPIRCFWVARETRFTLAADAPGSHRFFRVRRRQAFGPNASLARADFFERIWT